VGRRALTGRARLSILDVPARVSAALCGHPDVGSVELVGSRAGGNPTALSDWDFHIHAANTAALARQLPDVVTPLEPLAAQWDRLTERATYMLVLPGAIKIDLFPGEERRQLEPPWEPSPSNLCAVDAHFWDWTLWLGSKVLGRRHDLVQDELHKLSGYLLGPLGAARPPMTVDAAVADYIGLRARLEGQWGISVGRRLGDEVSSALERHGVIGRP
jgi:hypothetical protein